MTVTLPRASCHFTEKPLPVGDLGSSLTPGKDVATSLWFGAAGLFFFLIFAMLKNQTKTKVSHLRMSQPSLW